MDKRIIGCLLLLLASCKQHREAGENAGIQYRGDTVYVAGKAAVNNKLTLYTVARQDYSAGFNTTGVVKAIAGQMAGIAPPFDGRITKSFVKLGQKIRAGEPVFELHSAAFSEAVKSYYQALQAMKMKSSELRRHKDLVANGVGVAKELEAAETDYEMAFRDYESAEANLRMLNINPSEMTGGQALKITSPIAGEVVQANMVIGQYVKSDVEPLATVAELGNVWVAAQVKENSINSIRPDDKVEIHTEADPGQMIAGHVSYVGELLDEETRSIQALITCSNTDRRLKPGMFASVRFVHAPVASILIPSAALLQKDESSYVLLREGEGIYVRRAVKATAVGPRESLVTEGLEDGDVIVSEGGIYIMPN
ncbi:MAG: efflux RND transporter periplasmic adaptor subunit [Tannerellaceae bacterium]|jgi:cobalt-zinc-cadmium efflux system membrane fusion protein|nr:efflux RND transporter periplasmic adaptor subunit [Tannerellaceae bacterium]